MTLWFTKEVFMRFRECQMLKKRRKKSLQLKDRILCIILYWQIIYHVTIIRDPLGQNFSFLERRNFFLSSTTIRKEDTPTFVQNWSFSTHIQLCRNVIVFFSLFVQKTNRLWVPCLKVKSGTKGTKFSLLHICRPIFEWRHWRHLWITTLTSAGWQNLSAIDIWSKTLALSLKSIFIYKAVWRNCRKRLNR